MRKEAVTGMVTGVMTVGGFYLYDKIKDSGFVNGIKSSFSKLFLRTAKQKLDTDVEYQNLKKELDVIKNRLSENQSIIINQFKEVDDNHLVTTVQLDDIKEKLTEIKTILEKESSK